VYAKLPLRSAEHNHCAMSISCYTRTCQVNDYVTLVTRIENGLVIICNVTLRKSRESIGARILGVSPVGIFLATPAPIHMLCQFSINSISVIDSWFSVCWTNMYLLIVRRRSEGIKWWEKERERERERERDDRRVGIASASAILPFHGPSDLEERVACLPAESETELRPECLLLRWY